MLKKNLNLGFVELVDKMGNATSVVNAARVSFNKRTVPPLDDQDKRLLKYLWKNKHTSPFRHVYFTFHIRAPITIFRQWQKHQIGSNFNEISGRYVQFENSFYMPSEFRGVPVGSVKQGSGDKLPDNIQEIAKTRYSLACDESYKAYLDLIECGVCREQARMILPNCLFSECFWTCSLQAVIHFLNLRLAKNAQAEIRYYAEAVYEVLCKDPDIKFLMDVCFER